MIQLLRQRIVRIILRNIRLGDVHIGGLILREGCIIFLCRFRHLRSLILRERHFLRLCQQIHRVYTGEFLQRDVLHIVKQGCVSKVMLPEVNRICCSIDILIICQIYLCLL